MYNAENFRFTQENKKIFVLEKSGEGTQITAYDIVSGNAEDSMNRFQSMCAQQAAIGLDYADLVAAVKGSSSGCYYCENDEEHFRNIMKQCGEDILSVLILLEGDVSLTSIAPYQELFESMKGTILYQVLHRDELGENVRYHVWIFR